MRTLSLGAALILELTPAAPAAGQIAWEVWFPGTSSVLEREIFPLAFRGSWAPDAAACADVDGVERLTVYAQGVDFHESGARLERITQTGDERSVKLKLSYEGEGEFWDREEVWTLSPDGRELTIAIDGRPGRPVRHC